MKKSTPLNEVRSVDRRTLSDYSRRMRSPARIPRAAERQRCRGAGGEDGKDEGLGSVRGGRLDDR